MTAASSMRGSSLRVDARIRDRGEFSARAPLETVMHGRFPLHPEVARFFHVPDLAKTRRRRARFTYLGDSRRRALWSSWNTVMT